MKQTPEQWDGLVRRLNDGGCPVRSDHGYKVSPVGLVIEKIPGMSFNSIFDLKQGGTGYAIELTLRNEATRPDRHCGVPDQDPLGVATTVTPPGSEEVLQKVPALLFSGTWSVLRRRLGHQSLFRPAQEPAAARRAS